MSNKNKFKPGQYVIVIGGGGAGELAKVVAIRATKKYGPERNIRIQFNDRHIEYFAADELEAQS